jgi:uncharacterized membrane protein
VGMRFDVRLLADTLYDWLLLLHILAAMAWVGGLIVLTVLSGSVLRDPDPAARARFIRFLRRVGPMVLAPATVLVIAMGIWMVAQSDAWSLEQRWVRLGLVLFFAAFLIGAVFQSRAAVLAERASKAGDDVLAARQLRRWTWGMRLILVILVVTAWDMVFKPGA